MIAVSFTSRVLTSLLEDFKSIYHKDYLQWDVNSGNKHTVNHEMLRRTNYTNRLPENQHNHYGSIYKTDFPTHPLGSASLNEEQKADLRKHHFQFGFDPNASKTKSDYHDEFVKKEIPKGVRDEAEATRARARASVSILESSLLILVNDLG